MAAIKKDLQPAAICRSPRGVKMFTQTNTSFALEKTFSNGTIENFLNGNKRYAALLSARTERQRFSHLS